uniref:Cytochrome c oxidase subunit 3 n=2 Tax=Schmidtea mediterranea TaxID=79327 RepID=I1ZI96_SCHMD|nr:cytochrome c oxidase subunit III [Schmidtea mediterranea]
MFFFGFFWSYFHNCLNPSVFVGTWPPYLFNGIVVDPFGLPLLNTVLLLSSGVSVTFCHYCVLSNVYLELWSPTRPSRTHLQWGYYFTLFYGILFLSFQISEYISSYISINSTVYGSVFFLLTGFHGFHVVLGLILLSVSLLRVDYTMFSDFQHLGLECSIWYWHFVDVVWLFLYFFVYWYGYYIAW